MLKSLIAVIALLFCSQIAQAREGSSAIDPNHERFKPSIGAFNIWEKDGKDLEFSEYIETAKQYIQRNHWFIPNDKTPRKYIELISPQEFVSENCSNFRNVLLVHGLSDSPYLMRDVLEHLKTKGCIKGRSILLPGHATRPGDLARVTSNEWKAAVRYGINSFKGEPVDVIGFSTGGATATNLAMTEPEIKNKIKSLILLSPAFESNIPPIVEAVMPLRGLILGIAKLVSFVYPQVEWLELRDDLDFAKYESFPLNAGIQLRNIQDEIALAPGLDIPVLMIASWDDQTIKQESALRFLKEKARNPNSRAVIYVRADQKKPEDIYSLTEYVAAGKTTENGCNTAISHVAIPVSPNNYHYGSKDRYRNCLGYFDYPDKYRKCLNDPVISYGEPYKSCYEKGEPIFARITYNKQFDVSMAKLTEFLGLAKAR